MWPFGRAQSKERELLVEGVLSEAYALVGQRRNHASVRFGRPVYVEVEYYEDEHKGRSAYLPYSTAKVLLICGRQWALCQGSKQSRFDMGDYTSDITALDLGESSSTHTPIKILEEKLAQSRFFENSLIKTSFRGDLVVGPNSYRDPRQYGEKMTEALGSRLERCIAREPVVDRTGLVFMEILKKPRTYKYTAVEVVANAIETVLLDYSLQPQKTTGPTNK